MPELPEVETVVRELSKQLTDKNILQIKILNPKLRYPIPNNLITFRGSIKSIKRQAKYIIISIDNDQNIVIHLGMTGKVLIINSHEYKQDKHDHLIINLDNNISIVYNDTRKFGLITTPELAPPSFYNSAPDPFAQNFSITKLKQKLSKSSSSIKSCIMNNDIITGVGNIYANEALFKANILPTRAANTLSNIEINRLIEQIIVTLKEAIQAGGSSIKDYRNSSGKLGYFQQQHFVYNKKNTPCKICQNKIEHIQQSGRSSFFCSKCQK